MRLCDCYEFNKNTVKVIIDYANSSSTDIVIDKMTTKKNGSDYNVRSIFV